MMGPAASSSPSSSCPVPYFIERDPRERERDLYRSKAFYYYPRRQKEGGSSSNSSLALSKKKKRRGGRIDGSLRLSFSVCVRIKSHVIRRTRSTRIFSSQS